MEIPYNRKKFGLHMGMFLRNEFFAGQGTHCWKTDNLFTPPNLVGENSYEDAPGESLKEPRKVHYRNSWKIILNTIFSQAEDQGLQFQQTKSSAIVVNGHVPASCTQKGGRVLCEGGVPTPRKAAGKLSKRFAVTNIR